MKDKIILGLILTLLFSPIFICLAAGAIQAYQSGLGLLGGILLFTLAWLVIGVFTQ